MTEKLVQDIHGSRIVRYLSPEGWQTFLFCPADAKEGVECADLAEAIKLAKEAKAKRAEASGTDTERTEPETVTAGTLSEGIAEVIERVIEEETT